MVDEVILLVTLSDNALDVFNGKRYRKHLAIRLAGILFVQLVAAQKEYRRGV
jgi:hypothetical protein